MTPSSIAGFITKKETAQFFQRSHRQLTRDLADAMKMQNPKVLDNCRLRTEDDETRDGMGVTPELLDELRIAGNNPVWYLRVTWLEKTYGRRGRPQRPEKMSPEEFISEKEGSDASSRPDVHCRCSYQQRVVFNVLIAEFNRRVDEVFRQAGDKPPSKPPFYGRDS